jgi:hypothetical protein
MYDLIIDTIRHVSLFIMCSEGTPGGTLVYTKTLH